MTETWRRAHDALLRIAKQRSALDREEGRWLLVAYRERPHERLGFGSFVEYVERLVRGREPGDRPDDPAKDEARRHRLSFNVSANTLATFREAVAELRRSSSGPLDDDALLLLMARHLLGGPADDGRASYQIALGVCERCGAGQQQAKGEPIPIAPEVVEMARCDAQRMEPGKRATQSIPPAIRRQVLRRHHGCCAVPGCRNAVFLDLHHVDPRAEGGSHDPERLVVLCSAHHRAEHRGRLLIEGSASMGFTFRHADGSPYGTPVSAREADATSRAFRALTRLGYKQREARHALEQVRAHVGMGDEALLRAALGKLSQPAVIVADSRRLPTWARARSPARPARSAIRSGSALRAVAAQTLVERAASTGGRRGLRTHPPGLP